MDESRQAELASSREGLLKGHARSRSSTESAFRSSSDFDLDELGSPDENVEYSPQLRGGWSPFKKRREKGKEKEGPRPLRLNRPLGCLRRRECWLLTGILLALLMIFLASIPWINIPQKPRYGV